MGPKTISALRNLADTWEGHGRTCQELSGAAKSDMAGVFRALANVHAVVAAAITECADTDSAAPLESLSDALTGWLFAQIYALTDEAIAAELAHTDLAEYPHTGE